MATYTVVAGDSLSRIARDQLGDLTRWPEIARLNHLSAPYIIFPNQTLQLPDAAALPAPGGVTPQDLGTWLSNPWLWFSLAAAGGVWWWWRKRRRR